MELLSTFGAMLLPALLAALCGGVVGLEREIRDKPAGFTLNRAPTMKEAAAWHGHWKIRLLSPGSKNHVPRSVSRKARAVYRSDVRLDGIERLLLERRRGLSAACVGHD